MSNKWVHIIGICGVVTSGLAVMYKNLGWKVTGSDKGFFPPVSDYLAKYDIEIGLGYNPQRLTDEEGLHPDIVILQGVKSEDNAETKEARRLSLNVKYFTEIVSDLVLVDNSIVVTGTYGKTTITALIVEILKNAGIDISYMFGGLPLQMTPTIKAAQKHTRYSVVEGDEYLTSLDDKTSKFFYYRPKILLLNSCKWEHPDLFSSEEAYVENFQNLIKKIPKEGLIIANANDKNVVKVCRNAKSKVVYYSQNREKSYIRPQWYLENESRPLKTLIRIDENGMPLEIIPYEKKILGDFNDENILAASVLTYELGVKKERIQESIYDFDGIKRRLEIRYTSNKATIIDDFGSSPPKAKGSLSSIRMAFPKSKIVAIFEPNTGNRTKAAIPTYTGCFQYADSLIFPRFTKLPKTKLERLDETQLARELPEVQQLEVITDDDKLIHSLYEQILQGDEHIVVVFLGSHGFRGIIESLMSLLI